MNGFFIDDNAGERVRISRLLEQDGLTIDPRFEPTEPMDLRDAVLAENPDLLALDFRLDDEPLEANNYKGGALAQIMREAVLETPDRDFPIVLVSTEKNIKEIFSIDKTSHDLFDQKYMKGRLNDKSYRTTCHREMLSLAKGYKAITAIHSENNVVSALLAITPDELEIVPLQGFATDIKNAKSVTHIVSRLLFRQLIERAGPLLASKDVAARLGIANEPENIDPVMDLFEKDMAYKGVYSDGWIRIWRHRLEDWADENFGKPLSSIKGLERAAKVSEITGLGLKPAVSKWSNSSEELFAFACSICHDPTERRNSLALYDKYLLPYSERKRICFDCFIRGELNQFPQMSVDEADMDIANDVQSGEIAR